jgi:hypothetical protein
VFLYWVNLAQDSLFDWAVKVRWAQVVLQELQIHATLPVQQVRLLQIPYRFQPFLYLLALLAQHRRHWVLQSALQHLKR